MDEKSDKLRECLSSLESFRRNSNLSPLDQKAFGEALDILQEIIARVFQVIKSKDIKDERGLKIKKLEEHLSQFYKRKPSSKRSIENLSQKLEIILDSHIDTENLLLGGEIDLLIALIEMKDKDQKLLEPMFTNKQKFDGKRESLIKTFENRSNLDKKNNLCKNPHKFGWWLKIVNRIRSKTRFYPYIQADDKEEYFVFWLPDNN